LRAPYEEKKTPTRYDAATTGLTRGQKGDGPPFGDGGLLCTDGCMHGEWRGKTIRGFSDKRVVLSTRH